MDTVVTRQSHPFCFQAFEIISHDRGSGAGHSEYAIPEPHSAELDVIEEALSKLGEEQLETFSIGEFNDVLAIVERINTPSILKAHLFLNAFFDDFEEGGV